MVFGMSLATYTLLHVLISLIGIGSGLVVMYGLLKTNLLDRWTALFLATTVLTSISGFGFPFTHLLPSRILGILSLVVLAFAIPARYVFHLVGAWRWIYVVGSVLLISGFFVGNRGPSRPEGEGWSVFSLRRWVRWATPDEQRESLSLSAVLVVLGVVLIALGALADTRYKLV